MDRPRSDRARVGEERRGDAGDSGSWGSAVRGFRKTLHDKLDWIAKLSKEALPGGLPMDDLYCLDVLAEIDKL